MLEEYLCMGGNEIANNARAWGYGTSAGCPVTWYRCEPCDTLHDSINDWIDPTYRTIEYARNLYTNPSFETTAGTVTVRTNLLTNPRMDNSVADWAVVGTGVTQSAQAGGTRIDFASAVTSQGPFLYSSAVVASASGETAYAGIEVGVPSGYPATTVAVGIRGYLTGGGSVDGTASATSAAVTIQPGQTVRLTSPVATGTATTVGGWRLWLNLVSPGASAGGRLTVRNAILEKSSLNTQPYFDGANRPRLRENGTINPRFVGTANGGASVANWSLPATAGTWGATDGAVNISDSAPVNALLGYESTAIPASAGEVWTVSRLVSVPADSPAVTVRLSAVEYIGGSSGQVGNGDTVTIQPGTSVRLTATSPALAATATGVRGILYLMAATGTGRKLVLSEALVERAATTLPFFDGATTPSPGYGYAWSSTANFSASYLYDDDLTPAWSGTANASTSVLRGVAVTGIQVGNADRAVRIRSTRWTNTGLYSVRIIPGENGYPAGSYAEGTVMGLTIGRTYTVIGTVHIEKTLVGPLTTSDGVALGFWVIGSPNPVVTYQSTATNAPGDYVVRGTFVANSLNHGIRFMNGADIGGGDVWWDSIVVAEGEYLGDYFDGDTAEPSPEDDIRWAGTANASASIWERTVITANGQSAEPPYTVTNIQYAPWYDADNADVTGRFYGVFIISIEGVDDSTRSATVTEGILDGGVVGLVRHKTREMRVRALLAADGQDALEYGLAWLNAALAADGCSTHGASCGAVDINFLGFCPERDHLNDPTVSADNAARNMHTVTVTSGPLIEQQIKSKNGIHWGYLVEWTMVAGTPFIFSQSKPTNLDLLTPVVMQDVPYNLVPYPSAELSSGTVTLATNYVTNPSIETDASGWTAGANVITPAPTGARSTEIAASGTASYKVSVTTTNTSTAGSLYGWRDVTLPTFVTGQRFSFTTWAALFVVSGTAVLTGTKFQVEWRDASTVLSTVIIGTGLASGGVISSASLVRPPTAITARVVVLGEVASWSTGAVLNLFIDAVAVTIP